MATDETRLRRIKVRQWKPALDYLGDGEYVSTAVEDHDGEYYLVDDIAPLLAELADLREQHNELRETHNRAMVVMSTLTTEVLGLREQARRRDAATEPPPEGEWVLGRIVFSHALAQAMAGTRKERNMAVRYINGCWLDEGNSRRDIVEWWPLPPTEER